MGINNCTCKSCGRENKNGDVFCRYCGERLYCGNRSQNHVYDDVKSPTIPLESPALNKADLQMKETHRGQIWMVMYAKIKFQGKRKFY